MSPLEVLCASPLALLCIAGTLVASHRWAWACVGPRPASLRWTATLILGIALSTGGFQLLFWLGIFQPAPAAAAAGSLAVLSRLTLRGVTSRQMWAHDVGLLRRLFRGRSAWRRRPQLLLFAPLAALVVARALVVPPLAWDTLTYHGVRSAMFVQGTFSFEPGPGGWSLYRHFFSGAEVLVAWAMLPFHSDLLASFTNAVEWLALGLACWAFARELGVKGPEACLSAWASVFIPTLVLEVPSGYVEIVLSLCIVSSLAFGISFLRRAAPSHAFLALLSAGLAAGIKLPGALPAAIVAVFVIVIGVLGPRHRGRTTALAIALGVVCGTLAVAPWMWRAYVETGHLLTFPVELFGLSFGESDPALRWYLERDVSGAYTWSTEWRTLRAIFSSPLEVDEALGALTLVPLLLMPAGLVVGLRERPLSTAMSLLVFLSIVAFLYLPSVSVSRLYYPTSVSRYLIAAGLIAIPVSLLWCRSRPQLGGAYSIVLFACALFHALSRAFYGWAPFEGTAVALVVLGATLIGSASYLCGRRSRWLGAIACAALVSLSLGLLDRAHVDWRDRAAEHSVQLHRVPRYWLAGARALDQPSAPRRLAITGGSDQEADRWFTYLFLGRSLQNTLHYVPISCDGAVVHHDVADRRDRARRECWLERLSERDITDVVSFRPSSVELEWMESLPSHFRRIAGDRGRTWGVFRRLR
jgi:hypothetical protein